MRGNLCFSVILQLQIQTASCHAPNKSWGFCKMSISDTAAQPIAGSGVSIFFKLIFFASPEKLKKKKMTRRLLAQTAVTSVAPLAT